MSRMYRTSDQNINAVLREHFFDHSLVGDDKRHYECGLLDILAHLLTTPPGPEAVHAFIHSSLACADASDVKSADEMRQRLHITSDCINTTSEQREEERHVNVAKHSRNEFMGGCCEQAYLEGRRCDGSLNGVSSALT